MALSTLLLASVLTFAPIQAQNETTVEEPPVVEVEKNTEDELKEYIDELTAKYSNIETWIGIIFGSSGGVSLVSVIIALYTSVKNKKNSKEIEKAVLNVINSNLGTAYESLTKETLEEIIKKQEITQDLCKLMIKAFAFAQDKSAEGKKALLDLMIEINNLNGGDKVIEKQLAEKKVEITKHEEKVAETNKKVESEYIPVD